MLPSGSFIVLNFIFRFMIHKGLISVKGITMSLSRIFFSLHIMSDCSSTVCWKGHPICLVLQYHVCVSAFTACLEPKRLKQLLAWSSLFLTSFPIFPSVVTTSSFYHSLVVLSYYVSMSLCFSLPFVFQTFLNTFSPLRFFLFCSWSPQFVWGFATGKDSPSSTSQEISFVPYFLIQSPDG